MLTEASLSERVLDVDSHEMVPVEFWADVFDPDIAARMLEVKPRVFYERADNNLSRPDVTADDAPITQESVWTTKGPGAPGAIDFDRRLAVLDQMGIERQLVYPSFGLVGFGLYTSDNAPLHYGFDPAELDRIEMGRAMIAAHNRWAARVTASSSSRLRPVGIVIADDVPQMVADTEGLLASGVRALMLAAGQPPADTSPGDRALDPFWNLCALADVPVTLHVGTEFSFMSSTRWSANVPAFEPAVNSSIEFPIEPMLSSTIHLAASTYLTAMVLGGVFERHPTLRFGVIELFAEWVGPLARRLDTIQEVFRRRLSELTMRPSEYLARNVRVTPFYFEPIGELLDTYPVLEDILVYSSDYPHREGGTFSKRGFLERLEGHSKEVREKFFVRNGELLLPA